MVQVALSNTILQTIVPDDKRGRVMSFFMMAFLGTAPFGSLIAGALAERIGASQTLLVGGICCVLGALWFARGLSLFHQAVGQPYMNMGPVSESAATKSRVITIAE